MNRRAFSALLTCVLASASGLAQSDGRLAGTIKDATGAALVDVVVVLQGPAADKTRTDEAGRFAVEHLPDGEYELTASLPGFAPLTRSVRVTKGSAEPLSIILSVGAYEETVVTAARTGERDLQTVPIAITALPGKQLRESGTRAIGDLSGAAPSVTFSQNNEYAQLTIRGIGSNAIFAGSDPSSAVYVDGVYLARPVSLMGDFLDLDRVEVLRGPQGTLYGRNAVGGAMNLITRSPSSDPEASVRFVAGNLGTLRAEARASGPLVRDRVLASGAFLRGVSRGFVQNLEHPDNPLGGDDVVAARGKLQLIFGPRSDLLFSGDVTHQDPSPLTYAKVLEVKPGFQIDNPPDLHQVRESTSGSTRNLQYGGSARFTLGLTPSLTLTSLTSARRLDYHILVDADITELDLTTTNLEEVQHQVSEELTVSRSRGRVVWIGGVFLFSEVDHQPTSVEFGTARLENRLDPDVSSNSAAAFGHASVAIGRRLSLIGGLRFTRETKTIDNSGDIRTLGSQVLVPGSAYAYTDAIDHSVWTPKAGLEWQTTRKTTAYVSATRGFKSGGFNPTSRAPGLGYAPETAWSYEGGLKTRAMDDRMRVDVALFQTSYNNLQVQTAIRPGVIDISNAASATIRGLEFESAAQLSRSWHAGGHLAWLHALYDRYIAVGVGGVTGDVAGNHLNNAPDWSGRFWLEWAGQFRGATITARADSRWQSTVFFTPFNDAIQRQASFGLLDVSAELAPSRRWTFGLFARNLANTDYITGSFSSPPPAIGGRPGMSRQVGVSLSVNR